MPQTFRGFNGKAVLHPDRVEIKRALGAKIGGARSSVIPFSRLAKVISMPPTLWLNGWVYLATDADPAHLRYWADPPRTKVGGNPQAIVYTWWQRDIQADFIAAVSEIWQEPSQTPAGAPSSEDSHRLANFRVHVVPAVLALANPPWQRDVWLNPSTFENLDYIFHTLFDDFCDADEPERFLGVSLRTEEEVTLMRELGVALNAATAQAPNDTDEEHLQSTSWPEVVAVAGRLAHVVVSNDLGELVALHESETRGQQTHRVNRPGDKR